MDLHKPIMKDEACGTREDTEIRKLEWSTIHDLTFVKAPKKRGKAKANCVIVGGDDDAPSLIDAFHCLGLPSLESFVDIASLEFQKKFCQDNGEIHSPCSVEGDERGGCYSDDGTSGESVCAGQVMHREASRAEEMESGRAKTVVASPSDPESSPASSVEASGMSRELCSYSDALTSDSVCNVPGQVPSVLVDEPSKVDDGGFTSDPCDSNCEGDLFDCRGDSVCVLQEQNRGSTALKRNRQVSTDSGSSAAAEISSSGNGNRKANKKSKQRVRPKRDDDEEIERILAELDVGSRRNPVMKPKVVEGQQISDATDLQSDVQCNEKSKKKKKKKKQKVETISVDLDVRLYVDDAAKPGAEGESNSEEVEGCASQAGEQSGVVDQSPSLGDGSSEDAKCDAKLGTSLKRDRRKPGKRQLAAMQAALKKAREAEEIVVQEEMARQRRLEEADRLRIERLRLEQERKEKKKQKVKDKKVRMKAEGRLLTKAQKVARARVEAALSAWREHGIEVPEVGEKKSPACESHRLHRKKPLAKSANGDDDDFTFLVGSKSSLTSSSSSNAADDQSPSNWDRAVADSAEEECKARGVRKQRHLSDSKTSGSDLLSGVSQRTSETSGFLSSGCKGRLRTRSESDVRHSVDAKVGKNAPARGDGDSVETKLRSPVVCVLGHVDTGKTKILDKIRKTHVQDGEAGGITQQIGATMVPKEAVREKCHMVKGFSQFELELPGLLVIDTPGHESFRNLRSRGSSLCDMAILVVDVMHGLEQQTIESIELLKQKKTPFVVALNKVDRLYGWRSDESEDVEEVIGRQMSVTTAELDKKCKQIIVEFARQNLNVALYYENPDPRTFVSLVPVSAVTGDGMGNLLAIVCRLCQTMMAKRLTFSEELQATVLEVKTTAGHGTTIDVIIVNGWLKEADTIVLAGQDGPVVSQIRSILMPQPLKELRVKNPYREYKTVKGAQGIKISGKDLDKAIAGLPVFVARHPDDVPVLKDKMTRLFRSAMSAVKLSERGVYVQASTMGSLEALLDFLKSCKVPYAGVKVGPVVRKDVIRASVMLEHDIQYAVILAFDVKVEKDAQELADHLGIKLFQADIIYHLFDHFTKHREELQERKRNDLKKFLVFPCKLSVLPMYVFNIRDPIVIGVRVTAGMLKVGTPICVPSKNVDLGTVSSIEIQHQSVDSAKTGDEACVTIEPCGDESPKTYGRHFDHTDLLISKVSRQTIDVCKEFFRSDFQKADWQLMVELKKLLLIV